MIRREIPRSECYSHGMTDSFTPIEYEHRLLISLYLGVGCLQLPGSWTVIDLLVHSTCRLLDRLLANTSYWTFTGSGLQIS
ncbi:hypothetical protein MANES_05G183601v8 [Manihot esculenta]|uniref:Uncharacterized protein n=1 Tax=Manihot esculenta TaxID=3983 RepID=A0ACB7HS57_MANES|nr:hypothetical protein MANES_05G183601v8 [Manihot esculenta]